MRARDREWWRAVADPAAADLARGHAGEGDRTAEHDAKGPEADGSRLAFGALMAFTFILLIAPQEYIPALRPFRIAFLAAAVGLVAELTHRLMRRRPLLAEGRELRIVLAIVAWSLATAPFSLWPGGTISFLLERYLKTVAIFWLLVSTVNTMARLRQVAWMLAVLALPLALTAIKNFASGAFIAAAPGRIVGYGAPLTGNPNDLALTLNILLPLAAGLLLSARGLGRRVFLLGVGVLVAVGVVVTFSRAGLLTLLTIIAVCMIKLVRRGRPLWAAAALVGLLVTVPLLPPGYTARLATIASPESDPTGSAQERWSDMMVATRLVLVHPVGAGLGANRLAMNEERGATWRPIHNVYLEYGVELGLPGLMLFVALMIGCYRKVHEVERQTRGDPSSRELYCLASGIRLSLIAFAVAAMFHPVGYEFYFYYLAGLAVGAYNIHTVATIRAPSLAPGAAVQPSPPGSGLHVAGQGATA